MPEYSVIVPFAGYVYVHVTAKDEKEAERKAINTGWGLGVHDVDDGATVEMGDEVTTGRLSKGNVSYLPYRDCEVEET
jgi:hypothetical protein